MILHTAWMVFAEAAIASATICFPAATACAFVVVSSTLVSGSTAGACSGAGAGAGGGNAGGGGMGGGEGGWEAEKAGGATAVPEAAEEPGGAVAVLEEAAEDELAAPAPELSGASASRTTLAGSSVQPSANDASGGLTKASCAKLLCSFGLMYKTSVTLLAQPWRLQTYISIKSLVCHSLSQNSKALSTEYQRDVAAFGPF